MSSARQPEFFLDRSLGKNTAQGLRDGGHAVHLITDFYDDDAKDVPDEVWIADGCSRGWILLTKDKRIRYRARELAALNGQLFCLVSGNASIAAMTTSFLAAMPRIARSVEHDAAGFWHVYADGSIKRMWP
jgi:hypothetical protein